MWRADSLFGFIVKMVPDFSQLSSLLLCSQSSIRAGVLKTHRLSLDVPENNISPNVPSTAPTSTSRIVAGSLVIKDLLEHFGGFRKNDPSLQWEFGAVDVKIKTVVTGTKGTGVLQCCAYPHNITDKINHSAKLTRKMPGLRAKFQLKYPSSWSMLCLTPRCV